MSSKDILPALRAAGFNDVEAAALLANAEHESGMDPRAIGDNNSSIGLWQWHGPRADKFLDWAEANGRDPYNIKAQVDYLVKEMDPKLRKAMRDSKDPAAASELFVRGFERPRDMEGEVAKRRQTANEVHEILLARAKAGAPQEQQPQQTAGKQPTQPNNRNQPQPSTTPQKAPEAPQAAPAPTPAEDTSTGFLDRALGFGKDMVHAGGHVLHGAGTGIRGASQFAANIIPQALRGPAALSKEQIDADIQQRIAEREKASGGDYLAERIGEVVANLAMTAPALAIPGVGPIAGGAIMGAAGAAIDPVGESQDYWKEKASSVPLGAALGAGGGAVGKVLTRGLATPEARALTKADVPLTPGQVMGGAANKVEQQATSLPIVGGAIAERRAAALPALNKATYNEALAPLGKTLPKAVEAGHEGIQAVERTIAQTYAEVLPKTRLVVDDSLRSELTKISQNAADNLAPDALKDFNWVFENRILGKLNKGELSGEALKKLESSLSKTAADLKSRPDGFVREAGDAVHEALTTIRSAIARQNPEQAPTLAAANDAWANYAILREAASRKAAMDRGGVFTPDELLGAIRKGDRTVGKGATAKGQARMQDFASQAQSVLGGKVPDSGTAGRAGLGALGLGLATNPAGTAGGAAALLAARLGYTPGANRVLQMLLTRQGGAAANAIGAPSALAAYQASRKPTL